MRPLGDEELNGRTGQEPNSLTERQWKMSSTNLKNGRSQGEGEIGVPKARRNVFFLQEKNLSLLVRERDAIFNNGKINRKCSKGL